MVLTNQIYPKLQSGDLFPPLQLKDKQNNFFNTSDYRGRKNLILFSLLDSSKFVLSSFNHQINILLDSLIHTYPQFQSENTELIYIIPNHSTPIHETDISQSIIILDRYAEIYHLIETNPLPTAVDILDWIKYIELQCPE